LDFTEATDSEWQWHQLGHMYVCPSLQTDNHDSTPPVFYKPDAIPVARPTVSTQSTEGRCMVLLSCQEIACLDYACYIKIYQASKEYAQTTTAQWTCLPSQRCRSRCEHTRVAKVHNRSKTWPMAITQTSCMWKNCSGVGQEGGSHRIFFKLVKS